MTMPPLKKQAKNAYMPGTPVVNIEDGRVGFVLSFKVIPRKYLLFFPDIKQKVLTFRKTFATNCLTESEYSQLYWAWKGKLPDEKIEELLSNLGHPSYEKQHEAYVIEHGVDPETDAERRSVDMQ